MNQLTANIETEELNHYEVEGLLDSWGIAAWVRPIDPHVLPGSVRQTVTMTFVAEYGPSMYVGYETDEPTQAKPYVLVYDLMDAIHVPRAQDAFELLSQFNAQIEES